MWVGTGSSCPPAGESSSVHASQTRARENSMAASQAQRSTARHSAAQRISPSTAGSSPPLQALPCAALSASASRRQGSCPLEGPACIPGSRGRGDGVWHRVLNKPQCHEYPHTQDGTHTHRSMYVACSGGRRRTAPAQRRRPPAPPGGGPPQRQRLPNPSWGCSEMQHGGKVKPCGNC